VSVGRGSPLDGVTIRNSSIREQTGCRVVAVDGDSGLTTQIDPYREIEPDDRLTLVGTDDAVQEFLKRYDISPSRS